ncbi:MAG TPA: HAD family hydrolase [Ruminococcaceae bacterium]|jgi:CMP-N-acetylneuraminic acid synthetase|nr:HAD family hydrolase [Oscillospiraceae bacterium]
MKNVAFVPVKLNSQRLPNKNIKPFDNGDPLISYILKTLKQVKSIDEIYVYCSNEEIKKYLPEGIKYLRRSATLDSDKTLINEVLTSFAKDVVADVYVLAHATAPFLRHESIERGLIKVNSGEYDSALTVKKMQDFIWQNGKPFNYDLNNIQRTQDLEPLYIETTGLYIYSRELILKHNRRIGEKPYLIEVSEIEAVDINETSDFEIANAIFNSNLLK